MRSFLRGVAARLLPGKHRKSPNRRARTLAFEQLGARQLLAADGVTAALPAQDELATLEIAPASPVHPAGAESPLWGDPGGSQASTLENDGYGGVAPEIVDFSGSHSSDGWWTFTGEVLDDESVEGLTVTFGGLLEGHTTTVGADGAFEHVANIPPGTSGFVSVTVTDLDGLTSETVYFYVE